MLVHPAKTRAIRIGAIRIRTKTAALAALATALCGGLVVSCGDDDSDDSSGGNHGGGTAGKQPDAAAGAGNTGGAPSQPAPEDGGEPGNTPAGGSDGDGGDPGDGNNGQAGDPSTGGDGNSGGTGGMATGYSCDGGCGDGEMCCPIGVRTECVPADAEGCKLPDLTISEVAAEASVDIDFVNATTNPCLLEEACVTGPGVRRVLVFETATPNIGTGDLIVGEPSMSNPDFEFSSCHGHYHFSGYATYELVDDDGDVVAAGHKQAFCMRDDVRVLDDSDVRSSQFYNCDSGDQGISRGWSDVYHVGLDCQWVDITGVPAGDYLLRLRVNPDRRLYELDYDNNEILVAVSIP